MRTKFLANEIANAIVNLLTEFEFLKVCQKGDLSILPAPEQFEEYMPMCLVDPLDLVHGEDDLNPKVVGNVYNFIIRYLEYYNPDTALYEFREQVMDRGQQIAEKLVDTQLDVPGCRIVGQKVEDIDFRSTESLIFRSLRLPVEVVEIHFIVYAIYINKKPNGGGNS